MRVYRLQPRAACFRKLAPTFPVRERARRFGSGTGKVAFVTETAVPEIVIQEALAVIDQALGTMQQRALVSSDEVADLLLDLRLLLASAPALDIPVATGV